YFIISVCITSRLIVISFCYHSLLCSCHSSILFIKSRVSRASQWQSAMPAENLQSSAWLKSFNSDTSPPCLNWVQPLERNGLTSAAATRQGPRSPATSLKPHSPRPAFPVPSNGRSGSSLLSD